MKRTKYPEYPVIDVEATGRNILHLRKAKGLTVREMQSYFGFEEPAAIYRWQRGENLPSLDNMVALAKLFDVPMEEIIVLKAPKNSPVNTEIVAEARPTSSVRNVRFLLAA